MVNNTIDLQLRKQKDTIVQLNKLVAALKDTIADLNRREEEIASERDDLKAQVEFLSEKLYGSPNAKRSSTSKNIPGQMSLFDMDGGSYFFISESGTAYRRDQQENSSLFAEEAADAEIPDEECEIR